MAQDRSTTFAQNIDNFIACTRESKESNPQIIMRNIRQFMSGMKNYLVKHGEKGFYKEIERERSKVRNVLNMYFNIHKYILYSTICKTLFNKLDGKYFIKSISSLQFISMNIFCFVT